MTRLRKKGVNPFECEYIDSGSIYVNYGTVICTAINTTGNVFIPKDKNGDFLKITLDDEEKGPISSSNIVSINGSQKGCVCLNITFQDLTDITKNNIEEWEKSLFAMDANACREYLLKNSTIQKLHYIEPSSGDISKIDISDPELGLGNSKLVPITSLDGLDEETVKLWEEGLAFEKKLYTNWIPEGSAYYTVIDPNNPSGIKYLSQPRFWLNNTDLFPLMNLSAPILDVKIEFHPSDLEIEEEEFLDKYNFIETENDIKRKLVPIAYLNATGINTIEQLIDFDYIFNFPYYFNTNNYTDFLTQSEQT